MADRKNYHFRQIVTEAELDGGFEQLENAERNLFKDLLPSGIVSGLGVTQAGSPNLTVSVAAGTAYDADGQRLRVGSTQPLNIAVDSNGVSTAVGSGGNAKVVSVFLAFSRALSDPRVDGNSVTVYFEEAESFSLIVRQGLEATLNSEVATALEADKVLLCDIKRTFGQTQILNADINPYATNRRQDAYVSASGLLTYRTGLIKSVFDAFRDHINDTILSPSNIGGNVDNYDPTGFTAASSRRIVLRQGLSSAATLRGIKAKAPGTTLRILNLHGSASLTLANENANSTAVNRIMAPNGTDLPVRFNGGMDLWYDGTLSRWRVIDY